MHTTRWHWYNFHIIKITFLRICYWHTTLSDKILQRYSIVCSVNTDEKISSKHKESKRLKHLTILESDPLTTRFCSEAATVSRNVCTGIGPYPSGTRCPVSAIAVQSMVAPARGINRNASDVLEFSTHDSLETVALIPLCIFKCVIHVHSWLKQIELPRNRKHISKFLHELLIWEEG